MTAAPDVRLLAPALGAWVLLVGLLWAGAPTSVLVGMSGANYIHDIAGLMEFDLTVSYEKLVVDNEILGMCQRVLRGIEVTDDTLATELMIEKGPTKDYLEEDHTVEYMRQEFFRPRLANRDKRETRQSGDDAISRARAFVKSVREAPRKSLLGPDLSKKLLAQFPEIRTP